AGKVIAQDLATLWNNVRDVFWIVISLLWRFRMEGPISRELDQHSAGRDCGPHRVESHCARGLIITRTLAADLRFEPLSLLIKRAELAVIFCWRRLPGTAKGNLCQLLVSAAELVQQLLIAQPQVFTQCGEASGHRIQNAGFSAQDGERCQISRISVVGELISVQ